jgi:hypothetical protein
MTLFGSCARLKIVEILQLPDIVERIDLYAAHRARAQMQIRRCAKAYGSTVVSISYGGSGRQAAGTCQMDNDLAAAA